MLSDTKLFGKNYHSVQKKKKKTQIFKYLNARYLNANIKTALNFLFLLSLMN